MPKQIPKNIGWGEGGQHLPSLQELLDAAAKDLQAIYAEVAGLDAVDRNLRASDETPLEVVETTPEEGAEDVVVSADIEIEFDRNIEFTDNESTTMGEIELYNVDDETEHESFDTATISDKTLTIDLDDPLTAEKTYRLTIPVEDTINGVDGAVLKKPFVLTFKTAD